mmetsp:Transcript_44064/g.71745  ORF Transcript_44064/g.71745 Transcript_44064/m.71745 type:complete len:212 (-) Transcript_44064:762-1397(-)|eukprot:CAMPEP_0184656856 /NCGR_PEP_ID=MMETSP0308-20130426/16806_1 /TAXON_ID=38269 /ORGANISM="Gloeochaete witrockiana, Strain SAG 46.84" /LENGTH=211 /DNA_ID=CAMNT_0027094167 /DNA_START=22 /DNA_END=657 /DNA_ORIENTATION=+
MNDGMNGNTHEEEEELQDFSLVNPSPGDSPQVLILRRQLGRELLRNLQLSQGIAELRIADRARKDEIDVQSKLISILREQLVCLKSKTDTLEDSSSKERADLWHKIQIIEDQIHKNETILTQLPALKKLIEDLRSELDRNANQLTQERNVHLCSICADRNRDTLIFPCLHLLYCGQCIKSHQEQNKEDGRPAGCPMCRENIMGVVKVKGLS